MSEHPLRDLPGLLRWGDELHEATRRAEVVRAHRRMPLRRMGLMLLSTAVLLVVGAAATHGVWA